jgi:undecaprenyl pyrophosphate synthase
MPIDPKKFKEIVTNHFDNLSEEEFLKTLHKSSPYLFDGSSEAKHDIPSSDRDEITSLNIIKKLSPISNYGSDGEVVSAFKEEADRMESNNIDPITIRSYISKQKLIYTLSTVIQSVIYLTDKITKAFTKRA